MLNSLYPQHRIAAYASIHFSPLSTVFSYASFFADGFYAGSRVLKCAIDRMVLISPPFFFPNLEWAGTTL